jgi:hypothetical protein
MNELKCNPKRKRSARRQSTEVTRFPGAVPAPALPPLDWGTVFAQLPQEEPKTFTDEVWNLYKDNGWTKYGPESRFGFELARLVARDRDMPDFVKLLANIVAGAFVVDGLKATGEGIRKDAERQKAQLSMTSFRIGTPVPQLFPAWPS